MPVALVGRRLYAQSLEQGQQLRTDVEEFPWLETCDEDALVELGRLASELGLAYVCDWVYKRSDIQKGFHTDPKAASGM